MDRLRALLLLSRLGRMGPVRREQAVQLSEGRCVVYEAEGHRSGVLVMIHGMSPRADRDPRWVQIARGFARAGLMRARSALLWRRRPRRAARIGGARRADGAAGAERARGAVVALATAFLGLEGSRWARVTRRRTSRAA